MSFKKGLSLAIAAILLLCSSSYAMEFRTDDGYIIHYNALSTEMLPSKVLRSYGIVRSKHRGLLNIAVRKGDKKQYEHTKAVFAKITAQSSNLAGQFKALKIQRIEEGNQDSKAIYYIAVFSITNAETLEFTITVDPDYQGKAHKIKFRQEFFID
jgi:hypothetical protein